MYDLKKLLTYIMVSFLAIGFIRFGGWNQVQELSVYLTQTVINNDSMEDETEIPQGVESNNDVKEITDLEKKFSEELVWHNTFIDINGYMAKKLGMKGIYSNMGMYITEEDYIVMASDYTTTDYEYEQLVSFYEFCQENGINLLYVNLPTKYNDDNLFQEEFGINTYSNQNADLFVSRIRNAGIPIIDLRDNLKEEGRNITDLFYRTDHHWNVPAGLWASGIIAQGLNDFCGYNIDTSLYNKSNYDFIEYKNCWLGEQGRKVSKEYVGLDDYTVVKPKFETNFYFVNEYGSLYEGTFDEFIDESIYEQKENVYNAAGWHYSYSQRSCINKNIDYGKILLLDDSYGQNLKCFLACSVNEIDVKVLREYLLNYDLRADILNHGYDTVVIAYAQFNIGAHDDKKNANYRMFTFDKLENIQ